MEDVKSLIIVHELIDSSAQCQSCENRKRLQEHDIKSAYSKIRGSTNFHPAIYENDFLSAKASEYFRSGLAFVTQLESDTMRRA